MYARTVLLLFVLSLNLSLPALCSPRGHYKYRFDCGNEEQEIPSKICDGNADCTNGADERNCILSPDESVPVFDCGNGLNVPGSFLCNDKDDCGNAADERGCIYVAAYGLDCGNGSIVPRTVLCDGQNDCATGADERNCGPYSFFCDNSSILFVESRCNGVNDCGDNSDERNCVKPASGMFDCGNTRHVSYEHVCDGRNDCRNGEDERNCPKELDDTLPIDVRVRLLAEREMIQLYQSRNITSPGFPRGYPNGVTRSWKITTLPGHTIKLVSRTFRLGDRSCAYDSVKIRDGLERTSPLIATLCGELTEVQPYYESTGNQMSVFFSTDDSKSGPGFLFNLSPECGGVLEAEEAERSVFSHPLFGYAHYGSNQTCEWTIGAFAGTKVKIDFKEFSVGNVTTISIPAGDSERNCSSTHCNHITDACQDDYVEIFDGSDGSAPLIGKWCGTNIPPAVRSTNLNLFLRFRSGWNPHGTGFEATYKLEQ